MPIPPLSPSTKALYSKAPAVEVMYSVRTALPEAIDVERFLDAVKERFPNEFVEHREIKTVQGNVALKTDGSSEGKLDMDTAGYRFNTADKSFVAQYLIQGLTLNFLPPYAGFAKAMVRLKAHWAVYKLVAGDAPMVALSMRYIDRIDIPQPADGTLALSEYFPIAGKIPDGLSTHHCYQQHWLNDPTSDIRARVIWSSLDDKAGHYSFALDTEAILDSANLWDEDKAWERFNDLHAWCWHVFEQSTTDKCKALFK